MKMKRMAKLDNGMSLVVLDACRKLGITGGRAHWSPSSKNNSKMLWPT
jgi:hypothetical protein